MHLTKLLNAQLSNAGTQHLLLYITKGGFFLQLNSSHCTSPNAHFSQHFLLYITKGTFFLQLNSSHCTSPNAHFSQHFLLYITKGTFFLQLNSSHCTSPNAHFSQHLLLYMTKGAFFLQLNNSHCKLEEVHFIPSLSNTGLTCHRKSRWCIWSCWALLKWEKHIWCMYYIHQRCFSLQCIKHIFSFR